MQFPHANPDKSLLQLLPVQPRVTVIASQITNGTGTGSNQEVPVPLVMSSPFKLKILIARFFLKILMFSKFKLNSDALC
jgi:hypothetical protein